MTGASPCKASDQRPASQTISEATSGEHPRGLYVMFFTEMWERFSFYGMRALLVLYMIGHRSISEATATRAYGWYTASIFVACACGGYLADRWIASGRLIVLGASLMLIGHLLMMFDRSLTFVAALVL